MPTDEERKIVSAIWADKTYGPAINTMLESGWDFRDPAGRMNKPPEEIREFLAELAECPRPMALESEKRARLIQMIVDSWVRWCRQQQEVM